MIRSYLSIGNTDLESGKVDDSITHVQSDHTDDCDLRKVEREA